MVCPLLYIFQLAPIFICGDYRIISPCDGTCTITLMLVICIPTITEHLVVAVQLHHFNSQSQYNQLGAFTKS